MALHLVTGYSGKAHVTSADQGALNAATFGRGNYVLNVGQQFSAMVITNNSINVLDGEVIMQGRHIRLEAGAFEEVTIENGAQGYFRNDLICIRYTKDSTTGIEEAALVVIKGNPDASAAVDPAYNNGSILDGILTVDFPLYRVPLNGLNVGDLVPLFEVKGSIDERIKALIAGTTPVGNANKLGGKNASEYALDTDLANYLPLSTDAGTAVITRNKSTVATFKNSVDSDRAWIGFRAQSNNLGYFGFKGANNPVFSTETKDYELLHTGNIDTAPWTELTSGFDLNNALGRYRTQSGAIVKTLLNLPSSSLSLSSCEIIVEFVLATVDSSYGIQTAILSNSGKFEKWIRHKNSSTWGSWERVFTSSGGTLSGDVTIQKADEWGRFKIVRDDCGRTLAWQMTSDDRGNRVSLLANTLTENAATLHGIVIRPETENLADAIALRRGVDGSTNYYNIHHDGNSAKVAIQSSAPSDKSALWVW